MRGAANLHDTAVYSVMGSPMAFFDITPVGRIINRFSKDLDDSKCLLESQLVLLFATELTEVFFLLQHIYLVKT